MPSISSPVSSRAASPLFNNSSLSNPSGLLASQPGAQRINRHTLGRNNAPKLSDNDCPSQQIPRDNHPDAGICRCIKQLFASIQRIARAVVQFFANLLPSLWSCKALSQAQYYANWEAWAKMGDPSEQREVAVLRMKMCLEHGSGFKPGGVKSGETAHESPIPILYAGLPQPHATLIPILLCDVKNKADLLYLEGLSLTSLPEILPPCEILAVSENRLTVLPKLPKTLHSLYVGRNVLTSLQKLPHTLKVLHMDNNQFTRLPKNLPSTLETLYASCNQFTRLQKLPRNLKMLNVNYNRIESLPKKLPRKLEELHVAWNRLTQLPRLPLTLDTLKAGHNRLKSVPELPSRLRVLDLSANGLKIFPELPSRLGVLYLSANGLKILPQALPATLFYLEANSNNLSSFPETIFSLSHGCDVRLQNNPFSEETWRRLESITTDPNYPGPVIRCSNPQYPGLTTIFRDYGPVVHSQRRPLTDAVKSWLPLAQHDNALRNWEMVGLEPYAPDFSRFLDRLAHTKSARTSFVNRTGFKEEVAAWIIQLGETPPLRQATFFIATGATGTCEDGVVRVYGDMKKVAIRHDIEHEKYDAQLPKVVALGREMFRLEQLEKIACAKFEALKLAREKSKVGKPLDDVEVYLAYPVKLREDLQLFNMVVPEMYGFDYSSLENSDLITARDEVMRREDQDFPAWLSQWSPWQSVMQRLASAELKQEVEAQLNAENLENNEASRPLDRQVSAFDMQLTRKVLAAHHVLSSLDKKWKNV